MGALLLFGAWYWFWILALVCIVICFISDVEENGFFAFGTLVVFSVLFYFKGSGLDLIMSYLTLPNILIYLGIGLGFSFLRTFFAARTLGHEIKDLPLRRVDAKSGYTSDTQEAKKEIFARELKGNVFRWWFMWPISLLTWIATDIVKDVYDWVYSKMSRFYNWITDLGVNSIK